MVIICRECLKKFGSDTGEKVWEEINKAFDCMPLAALVDMKIFCCHGGIPAPWLCPQIEYINRITCPLPKPNEQSALAWDLLWNDPIRENSKELIELQEELNDNEGFAINRRRSTAHVFDSGALLRFLKRNKLSYVVRAHEVFQPGVQIHLNRKLITVFSSSFYNGGDNDAACLMVLQNKLRILRVDTTDYHRLRSY